MQSEPTADEGLRFALRRKDLAVRTAESACAIADAAVDVFDARAAVVAKKSAAVLLAVHVRFLAVHTGVVVIDARAEKVLRAVASECRNARRSVQAWFCYAVGGEDRERHDGASRGVVAARCLRGGYRRCP